MSSSMISLAIEKRIAVVMLQNPPGNAINQALALQLRDICQQLRQDDDVWVVVLTGQGDTFCDGTDPAALAQLDASTDIREALRSLKAADSVAAIEKPVIAALNGDAFDQGLEIALACDIRVALSQASFGLRQVQSGSIPWDGGTQRLPRLIGKGRTTEMLLTSRIVDSQEALESGLVNRVVEHGDVLTQALETASTISKHGPIAARYLKETVLNGQDMTLEQGLHLEADLNLLLQTTSDRVEGISSFLNRGTPEYSGE